MKERLLLVMLSPMLLVGCVGGSDTLGFGTYPINSVECENLGGTPEDINLDYSMCYFDNAAEFEKAKMKFEN